MTKIKIYTEEQVVNALNKVFIESITFEDVNEVMRGLTPIELPSDEEIEEKLNVAYGNGYEQGEMDFYKKMQVKGDKYVEGYSEGYQRALDYMTLSIEKQIKARQNEQQ